MRSCRGKGDSWKREEEAGREWSVAGWDGRRAEWVVGDERRPGVAS